MLHPIGVIHGRFQVLHNDHLTYLLAGKKLCDHLVVGITNPDPTLTTLESTNPERSQPTNNPLTYYERSRMVHSALTGAGIAPESFTVVPMPITHPELLTNYIPETGVCYLTIYDEWGREKEARLASLGLKTHIMWNKPSHEKGISATEVRRAIIKEDKWKEMVPPSVADLIEEWKIQERLIELSCSES